jgi:hypothetical protein
MGTGSAERFAVARSFAEAAAFRIEICVTGQKKFYQVGSTSAVGDLGGRELKRKVFVLNCNDTKQIVMLCLVSGADWAFYGVRDKQSSQNSKNGRLCCRAAAQQSINITI